LSSEQAGVIKGRKEEEKKNIRRRKEEREMNTTSEAEALTEVWTPRNP
jgi:hypothetical protein